MRYLLTVLIGWLMSSWCFAAIYYRFDERPLSVIQAAGGFQAQGKDYSIFNHVFDDHPDPPPRAASGYVSFTDQAGLRAVAREFYTRGVREVWLYQVSTTTDMPSSAAALEHSFLRMQTGFRTAIDPQFPQITADQFEEQLQDLFDQYDGNEAAMDLLMEMSNFTGTRITAQTQHEHIQQDRFGFDGIQVVYRVRILDAEGGLETLSHAMVNPSGSESVPLLPLNAANYVANVTNMTPEQVAQLSAAGGVSFCSEPSSSSSRANPYQTCPSYAYGLVVSKRFRPNLTFQQDVSTNGLSFGKSVRSWVRFSGLTTLPASDSCSIGTDAEGSKNFIYCFTADKYGGYSSVRNYKTQIADAGWTDGGQAFVDVNGDNKADYCRLVYLYTHILCDLSTGTGFSGQVDSGYVDGGYRWQRWWADVDGDGTKDFCRLTSSGMLCSLGSKDKTKIFKSTTSFTSDDYGWGDSRGFANIDGSGREAYCRLIYYATRLRCNLYDGKGTWRVVESQTIDGGTAGFRHWVYANENRRQSYCRNVGRGKFKCLTLTSVKGNTFMDNPTFDLPSIPTGAGGVIFADLFGRGIQDVCTLGSKKDISCKVYMGKGVYSASFSPKRSYLAGLGDFGTRDQVVLGHGPGGKGRFCRNVGFSTMYCMGIVPSSN